MIVANARQEALECTLCGELEGVAPKAFTDEGVMAKLMARVAADHVACEEWANNPRRAAAERGYMVRMRALLRATLRSVA